MTTRRARSRRRRATVVRLVAVALTVALAGLLGLLGPSDTARADGVGVPPAGASATTPGSGTSLPPGATSAPHIPVWAYFYQWFDRSSWRRAKQDFPLAGRYSSDDPHVLRDQVVAAQSTGITGFLTSWKSTPTLNRRLTMLLDIAGQRRLDVGVVYEALDFQRRPLPIATVRGDLLALISRWGHDLHSPYGRPVVVWTGTDQYSLADVKAVSAALRSRAYLLAAAKSVPGYNRVAAYVDGEAYYWSSANPQARNTETKLRQMSAAVHAHGGLWVAPAASGFDGSTLGHVRVVDRRDGQTLVRSLDNAYASRPDGIGVISWNEWSENTYIEPGERYRDQEITTLRTYLRGRDGSGTAVSTAAPAGPAQGGWSGLRAAALLFVITVVGLVVLVRYAGRRAPAAHAKRRMPPARLEHGPAAERVWLEPQAGRWRGPP